MPGLERADVVSHDELSGALPDQVDLVFGMVVPARHRAGIVVLVPPDGMVRVLRDDLPVGAHAQQPFRPAVAVMLPVAGVRRAHRGSPCVRVMKYGQRRRLPSPRVAPAPAGRQGKLVSEIGNHGASCGLSHRPNLEEHQRGTPEFRALAPLQSGTSTQQSECRSAVHPLKNKGVLNAPKNARCHAGRRRPVRRAQRLGLCRCRRRQLRRRPEQHQCPDGEQPPDGGPAAAHRG